MSVKTNKALTLSIIIPAYNEENHIRACLEAIKAQTVMPDEVIVVDNNSTDATAKIVKEYRFARIVTEKTQGIVHARNAGFNAATSDIIGRIDADSILPTDWVERIKRYYSKPKNLNKAFTGGGYAYNIRLKKLSGWLLNKLAYRANRLILGHFILWGSNMAFTRAQWQAVKASTCTRDDIHEDIDLSIHLHKAGYEIDYRPALRVQVVLKRIYENRDQLKAHMRRWPQTFRTHGYKLWWMGSVGNLVLWFIFIPLLHFVDFASKHILHKQALTD